MNDETINTITIPCVLDNNAIEPTKAHKEDAGFDIRTPKDFELYPGESICIDTGVHLAIPSGYTGFIKTKSSHNLKGLSCEGVIDSGFTGSISLILRRDENVMLLQNVNDVYTKRHKLTFFGFIKALFYVLIGKEYKVHDSLKPITFERGNKIGQLVILPTPFVNFVLSESLDATERGDGGFGSTGK